MLSVSELPGSLAWDQGLLKTRDYANFGPGLSSDRESEYQWERDSCGLNLLTLTVVISSIRIRGWERETYILSSWVTSDAQDAVLGADAISSPRKCVVLCLAPECPSQQFIEGWELLLTSSNKGTDNYWSKHF